MYRLAVLASGNGSNLQALIDAAAAGDLAAEVALVVADTHTAAALARADHAGIPTLVVERQPGEARADYDARLRDAVAPHRPDLVVLAGWMRILTPVFVGEFEVINLHPALPGELPGMHAIERAWQEALAGQRRLASAIAGGRPMFERPADRRFDGDHPEKTQEAAMLLDPASRLGENGVYRR